MQEIQEQYNQEKTSLSYTWCGERLDKRLSTQLPYSRSFFEHIIKNWKLKVRNKYGEKYPKKSYKLVQWDQIHIECLERFTDWWILEEAYWIDIEILLEKKDYLVIHKPKWVLSHPNSIRDLETPSVVAWAYHHYKDLPSTWNFIRAWLIHRLDKETDGVMLLAKTERGLSYFKELFQQKSLCETLEEKESIPLKKFYRARCDITPMWKTFLSQIESHLPFIIREDVIPKVPHPVIKEWITKILSISIDVDRSFATLDIEILTWRTHQIRYHLSKFWLPLVWDYLYNSSYKNSKNPHMYLTARRLQFDDVEWNTVDITIK